MTKTEKTAMGLLILYSAFYADSPDWWGKEICLACMYVFMLILFFAGGKKE